MQQACVQSQHGKVKSQQINDRRRAGPSAELLWSAAKTEALRAVRLAQQTIVEDRRALLLLSDYKAARKASCLQYLCSHIHIQADVVICLRIIFVFCNIDAKPDLTISHPDKNLHRYICTLFHGFLIRLQLKRTETSETTKLISFGPHFRVRA